MHRPLRATAGTTTSHTGNETVRNNCVCRRVLVVVAGPHKYGLRRDFFAYLLEAYQLIKKNTGNSRDEERMGSNGKKMQMGLRMG